MVYQKMGKERFQIFNKAHLETERGEKTISIFVVLPFLPYSSIVPPPHHKWLCSSPIQMISMP